MIVRLDYQNHSVALPAAGRPPPWFPATAASCSPQANYAAHKKALWAPLPSTVPWKALAASLGPMSTSPLTIWGLPSPRSPPAAPTTPFCHLLGEGNQRI